MLNKIRSLIGSRMTCDPKETAFNKIEEERTLLRETIKKLHNKMLENFYNVLPELLSEEERQEMISKIETLKNMQNEGGYTFYSCLDTEAYLKSMVGERMYMLYRTLIRRPGIY